MSEDSTRGPNADQSGWVTTKVAARMLRVDPRTVRKYIKQGKLVATSEGEGVEKTYLVSIDSLHQLRGTRPDPRVNRDIEAPESARSATNADLVDLIRDLTAEVSRRSSEAAELRARLELTERADSSQREALEQRLETERLLREQAEQERDELRRRLEGLQEKRDAPESTEEVVDTPTDRGARETRPDPQRQGRAEGGPPRYAESAIPRRSALTVLVPLPREYAWRGGTVINIGTTNVRRIIERYGSYLIGIVLTALASYAAALWQLSDRERATLEAESNGRTTGAELGPGGYLADPSVDVVLQTLALRIAVTVAFGIYVGIKDGNQPVWGRYNVLGAMVGIISAYIAISVFPESAEWGLASYLFGTWLMFFSGVLLGKAVQFMAEQERWSTPDDAVPAHESPGLTERWSARTTAIVGLIGALLAALVQVIGQVLSALL